MANPKSLIFQLHKHWDVIEALVRASREWPAFDEAMVLRLIGKSSRGSDSEPECGEILRSLCSSDVRSGLSEPIPCRSTPWCKSLRGGLLREHELGLSAVLKARIEAIKQATAQILERF